MRVVAIIPAAGDGARLGAKEKKPFILVGGKPLVSYALKAFDNCDLIDGIIAASGRPYVGRLKKIAKSFRIHKLIDVVIGGRTRLESVRNCIKRIDFPADIVVIHDAARPFVDESIIRRSIAAAVKFGAGCAAVPETDTVKSAGGDLFIKETLDRNRIFRAQTPQAFRYSLIKKAYSGPGSGATDDAGLLEKMGHRVKIVMGSYKNLKITTTEDLKTAEALLSE